MSVIWEWVPNSRLGPIKLGAKIKYVIETYGLLNDEDGDDATDWVGYQFPNEEIYVYAQNGIIVAITSYVTFLYKGKNIIGVDINELPLILDRDPNEYGKSVFFEDGDVQTPLEYDDLGLQLWVSHDLVTAASVMISGG